MRLVFFSSGGPGNFAAAYELAEEYPQLLTLGLLVCDRPGTGSAQLAAEKGIPCLEYDWEVHAAKHTTKSRAEISTEFHDQVLRDICEIEKRDRMEFDLAVLAYRQIMRGSLLSRFLGCCINQHPADLAVRDADGRCFTGIGGHDFALRSGAGGTRTSTILIRPGVDNGEIICRGPFVPFSGSPSDRSALRAHEDLQKRQSDWPSLKFALVAIATGRLRVSSERHDDGCRVLLLNGRKLPYGGAEASECAYKDLISLPE